MLDEVINNGGAAGDDIQDACGEAGFVREFDFAERAERDFFAGLEDEGVAAGDGHGPHPERDHDGEVERSDADAHTQGDAIDEGVDTDAALIFGAAEGTADGDLREGFAHHECGRGAGEFDAVDAAADVAACFGEGLAVFLHDERGEFIEMLFENDLVLEHELAAIADGHRGPGGESFVCGLHGGFGAALGIEIDLCDCFAGGGIDYGV